MATTMTLTAADGHSFKAYVAEPARANGNAVVVVQEIFGLNAHIRGVADDYAREGFWAIAPALFDRAERGIELGYTPADGQRGMQLRNAVGTENAVSDVAVALAEAGKQVGAGNRVGVVGYCWGGTLAWLAATRLGPGAAVGYYGGQIKTYTNEEPHCPVMLHFGKLDKHIPQSEIEAIQQRHPSIPIYTYDAGHGFNCDMRADYEPQSAALAKQRTLEFFRKYLAGGA